MNNKKLDFCLIGYAEGNKLYAELDRRILKICWRGEVSESAAKELLVLGEEVIDQGMCQKVILEKKGIVLFSAKARNWIKQVFLNGKTNEKKHKLLQFISSMSPASEKELSSNIKYN